MVEENNTFPKGEGEHDLYIGVRNDLSPFYVDLEALTRGLVIVGQSGCGKSFLIGRLVEEIVRKTTEKTRILIIDSNSDFCEGLELKGNEIFERQSLDYYKSGILKNREFDTFKEKEMQYFNTLKSSSGLPIGQLYGREKPFNLSWEWLVTDVNRFIQIVKANTSSIGYYFALCYLESNIVDGCKDSCGEWAKAAIELSDLRSGHLVAPIYLKFGKHIAPKGFDVGDCLELCNDIRKEIKGGVWRKNPKSEGFPESVFSDSRVNFIEIEKIIDKKSRLKVVACFLIHCLDVHRNLTEKYRDSWTKENSKSITEAEQYLKHTFILIDEAQNYAPEETNDPHEKMLGELIHTIAAEGRKYGLHVILATQRPNKIKRGLLGECDNAIIMKMNSRSDLEHLAREMRILDVKLLEPCLHFQGQGNALAVGEMTRMAPYVQLFKSAPRRTREGGVDIPGF
jgi:hypothetical protein